jgi:hypothetical protein
MKVGNKVIYGLKAPKMFANFNILYCLLYVGIRGGAVVEALRYKPEGRGVDPRWCHWNFSFRPHSGSGVDIASNRNEYQEYILGIKVTGA